MTRWPCSVWSTSGWNCTPASLRSTSSNAATAAPAVVAVTTKPSGAADTSSPWLIHTCWALGRSRNSTAPGAVTSRDVRPNSASPVRATVPPRAWAIAWKP